MNTHTEGNANAVMQSSMELLLDETDLKEINDMKSATRQLEMAYSKRRNSIVLTDPDTNQQESIEPHKALILAHKNGVKLTDVIDGKRVVVSV